MTTALGAGFLGGFYALLALANVHGPEFLGLLNPLFWIIALLFLSVAVFAPAFVAATLEFLAFEFAENRTNVCQAFAKIWRPALSFAARRVFPFFFAVYFLGAFFEASVLLDFWVFKANSLLDALYWPLYVYAGIVGVGCVYVFGASGPVKYLAATKRRLFCDKTEKTQI